MSTSIVGYGLLGVIGITLLCQVLLGLKRGVKKSLFRLGWLFATGLILFFVVPIISNWLNNYDISSFGLNIYGPVTKLSDIGVNILRQAGIDPSSSEAITSFAQNLPMLVLNVILFVALFWGLNTLLYPVWAIIATKVFDKKRIEERQYKKKIQSLKKKGVPVTDDDQPLTLVKETKNRPVGALLGVVIAILMLAVSFMPIVGLNAIYQNVYANVVTTDDHGREVPYLSTIVDEQILEYANSYEDSTAKSILTYSGTSALAGFLFDSMAVVKVQDKTITISHEVDVGIKAYNKVIKVRDLLKDTSNVKATDIDEIVAQTNELVECVGDSRLVASLGSDAINLVMQKYVLPKVQGSSFTFKIGEHDYTENVVDIVEKLAENDITFEEVKTNIQRTCDMVTILNGVRDDNNLSVLSGYITGEFEETNDMLEFVADNVKNRDALVENLVDSLYDVGLISDIIPSVINSGVEVLFDVASIDGYVQKTDLTTATLKPGLKAVLKDLLEFFVYYVDSDELDFGQNTSVALTCVGDMIDNLKGSFLTNESYNALVNFVIDKVNSATSSFVDLSNVTDDLHAVTSWRTELSAISPLYESLNDMTRDGDPISIDDVLEEGGRISQIGPALANVVGAGNSKLITNKNLREIFSALLDSLDTAENASIMEYINLSVDGKTIKNTILDNIWDETATPTKTKILTSDGRSNWANELNYTIAFLRTAKTTMANFDGTSSVQEFKALGKSIDDALANTKLFISSSVIRAYMDKFLTEKITADKINEILDKEYDTANHISVKQGMLNNIWNAPNSQVTSWETEMEILHSVISSTLSTTSTLEELGALLDGIAYSKVLSRDIVKIVVADYIEDEFDNLSGSDRTLLEGSITLVCNNVRNETQQNGVWPIVYADEFSRVLNLIDVVNYDYENDPNSKFYGADREYDYDNPDKEARRLHALGVEFNKLAGNVPGTPESKLLGQNVVTSMLATFIDKFVDDAYDDGHGNIDLTLANILKGMKGTNNVNLAEIVNYDAEFEYLVNLMDVAKDNTSSLEDIGEQLDECTSSVMLGSMVLDEDNHEVSTITRVVRYYFDKKVTNASGIPAYMTASLSAARGNIELIESYKRELARVDTLLADLQGIAGDWNTFNDLGTHLDETVSGEYPSRLITKTVVKTLILSFYTNKITSAGITDAGLNASLALVQDKLTASLDENGYTAGRYSAILSELTIVGTNVSNIKNVMNMTSAQLKTGTWNTDLGGALDSFAGMTYVCDRYIARSIAGNVVDSIVDAVEASHGAVAGDAMRAVINETTTYDFTHYYVQGETYHGSKADENYYTNLLTDIKNAIPA